MFEVPEMGGSEYCWRGWREGRMVDGRGGDGSEGVPGEEKTYTIIRCHRVEAQGLFFHPSNC